MSLALASEQHLMDRLPDELRRGLNKLFKRIGSGRIDATTRQKLAARITEVLSPTEGEKITDKELSDNSI